MSDGNTIKNTQDRYSKKDFCNRLLNTKLGKGQFNLDVNDKDEIKLSKVAKRWIQREEFTLPTSESSAPSKSDVKGDR